MKRKVCVVTGTRADYGLLRWVMEDLRTAPSLQLQVVATGMHLAARFGQTSKDIEADGFVIDRRVEMLLDSDTPAGVAKSMGMAMIGFADALQDLTPDLVLVLGDRFEAVCAALAATVARIPIAHIHGGELTQGAMDDAFRHAITKMAQLHFVAAPAYRDRVLQMGEAPAAVHLVGGLGVDAIRRVRLLTRAELEQSLGFTLLATNLLVTFHPATLDSQPATEQFGALLEALSRLENTRLILTLPNVDPQGRALIDMAETFGRSHPQARVFASLGQQRYLSCLSHVDAVVGNSSSGLLEAPSLGTATVNIGSRQQGRLRAASVIDCEPALEPILAALQRALSPEFRDQARQAGNPYGDGLAAQRIVAVLADPLLQPSLSKGFVDLDLQTARPRPS
jgi:GDP/UDP-N,N'-diacetylbacillosamine 2-epimerase (hydrolysing)